MKRILILILLVLTLTLTSCGKKYTVTFDTDGGSYIEAVEVKKRKRVERPEDPTKEGYRFVEWQLNGETFDFDTKIKKNITLVAVWKATGPSHLDAPANVRINGNTISWNPVNGATEYEVYIDGVKQTTKQTSLNYDFSQSPLAAVVVVAKAGKTVSANSEAVMYEYTYTSDEIYNILESHVSIREINEYPEIYNTCAQLVVKYNFDMDVFYGDFATNIYEYAKDNNPVDLICAAMLIGHSVLANDEGYEVSKPSPYQYEDSYLMQFYQSMCNAGIFTNPASTWEANDKFTLFIVPCMMRVYDFSKGESISSPYRFMEEIMNWGMNNIAIEKTEQGYKVTRTVLNKEMLFTETEISAILDFFSNYVIYGSYNSSLYNMRYSVSDYVEGLETYEAYNKIYAENERITKELLSQASIDKETLNQVIFDLFDAYEVVLGYEDKIEELMNDFENADTDSKINLLVEDAKNFAEQVADLVKDTLPTQEEVKKLLDLIEYAKTLLWLSDNDVSTIFSKYIVKADQIMTILEATLNDAISLTNSVLNIVEKIETAELKAVLDFANNLTTDVPTEVVNLVKKLFGEITDILGEFEFSKGLIGPELFDFMNTLMVADGSADIKGLLQLYLGYGLTQKEFDLVLNEAYEAVDYLLKYDFDRIIDLLVDQELSETYYKTLVNEVDSFVKYVLDYVTTTRIKKYESYVVKSLEANGYDRSYYQVVLDNLEAFKTYARINLVNSFAYDFKYDLCISSHTALKIQLSYYKQFSNKDITNMVNGLYNVCIKFEGDSIEYLQDVLTNPLTTNFQDTISKLEKCLNKQSWELTQNELDLIKYFELHDFFPFNYWRYPSVIQTTLDERNQRLVFSIMDQYQSQFDFESMYAYINIRFVEDDFDSHGAEFTLIRNGDSYYLPYSNIITHFENRYGYDVFENCEKMYISYGYLYLYSSSNGYYQSDNSMVGFDLTSIVK